MARRTAAAKLGFLAIVGMVALGAPAFAGPDHGPDPGEREYDLASDLHGEAKYAEAAAGWSASYQAGYRKETSAYNAACAFARGGRKDEAFRWLERAYAEGFDLEEYLHDDDDLHSLRGDPRFEALAKKVAGGRTQQMLQR